MRDSYERFFSKGYLKKEQFFAFGLDETIYAPYEKTELEWENLKQRVKSNQTVYIRGFGRNTGGTHLFLALYAKLFHNTSIKKDPTNNAEPTKLIRELTGYSKSPHSKFESIRNYQVSHIFGRTKNVLAFTAPWNIVYTPKMLDPFTGHEAKGLMVAEFTKLFQQQGYARFAKLIDDFNELVSNTEFVRRIDECIDELSNDPEFETTDIQKLRKAVQDEFQPICVPT